MIPFELAPGYAQGLIAGRNVDCDHHDTPFYNDAEGNSRGGDSTEVFYVYDKDTGDIILDGLTQAYAYELVGRGAELDTFSHQCDGFIEAGRPDPVDALFDAITDDWFDSEDE